MSDIKNLYETLGEKAYKLRIPFQDIPEYVTSNLSYPLFKWQKEAFENLLTYNAIKDLEEANTPTHILFNMATGTGKTLLMASTILYYYKMGYRHFIFFVNQNNIVDKTENNFIDNTHSKYLFKDKIVIDNKTISIKKVNTFTNSDTDIQIKFTTIQKLYNDIHIEKENQTTLDDLQKLNLVMLADEAHHLNADTKKENQDTMDIVELTTTSSKNDIEKKGWEHTVLELIWNKNGIKDNKNILLEFTATIDNHKNVIEKYSNKIIYKFGLKEFLQAGYTKEINLVSSTFEQKERILQALLFNWYRHKIALKYNIPNFKPVILFRSKTIDESVQDYKEFLDIVENLKSEDFDFLNIIESKFRDSNSVYEQGKSKTRDLVEFIKKEDIKYQEIINYIQHYFCEKNCIITNSKDKTAVGRRGEEKTTVDQDRLLNNLEDVNNHIRAIFTVDRLTEGWDVLNLFDIVRLYQGQNAGGSSTTVPEATTKEKQLIGRGVRYYPFTYNDKIANKRKFDDNLKHELRILEELFYYTFDEESRYISHLKDELKKDGYIEDNRIIKTFDIKKEFKSSDFYKETKIWYNKRVENPNRKKSSIENLSNDCPPYVISQLVVREDELEFNTSDRTVSTKKNETHTLYPKFNDFVKYDKHLITKALNIKAKSSNSFFQFINLQKELNITSLDDLLNDAFLGNLKIKIIVDDNLEFDDIDNKHKLNAILQFLDHIEKELKAIVNPYVGTEFGYSESFENLFGKPKTKSVKHQGKEIDEDWFVLDGFVGTSEEESLLKFITDTISNLKSAHDKVYLLRNEEVYKIYDFSQGRGFQPDFILFLKDKKETELYYQVFIEPKGDNLLLEDEWKNDFLKDISLKYGNGNLLKVEDKKYSLIGLPLYNDKKQIEFENEYRAII